MFRLGCRGGWFENPFAHFIFGGNLYLVRFFQPSPPPPLAPLSQILGGVLADKYGGDRVMTVSGLVWSLSTVLHPIVLGLARNSSHDVKLHILIVLRVVTGFFQGLYHDGYFGEE